MKKLRKKLLITSLLLLLFFLPLSCLKGATITNLNIENYPTFGNIDINTETDINELVAWGYYFLVGISGFSAFFMFVWGGFQWSSSAGDPNQQSEAKEKLISASIGLLLILSAYLILNIINPNLTILELPEM